MDESSFKIDSKAPTLPQVESVAPVEGLTKAPVPEAAKTASPDSTEGILERLAKQEKIIRQEARKRQELEKKLADRSPAPIDPKALQQEWKNSFLKDPSSVGFTPEEITKLYMEQLSPASAEAKALRQEIDALKKSTQEASEKAVTDQKAAYDKALQGITKEVNKLVETNESFELIKAMGRQDSVTALIEQTFKDEGYVMETEEAAKEVEAYLTERALAITKLNKIKKTLTPEPPVEAQKPLTHKKPQTLTTTVANNNTLTRRIEQGSVSPSASAKDRRARAIAAFTGKLAAS